MNELEEWCLLAYGNVRFYNERSKMCHNQKIRQVKKFNKGDQVLLYNFQLIPRKLKSRWFKPSL